VPADNEETFEHFRMHGWMRVRAAFSVDEAAAMRAAAWRALAKVGIRRSDPSTWTKERPEHLQSVKDDPAFRAVGSARLLEAIDAALEGQAYEKPKHCFIGRAEEHGGIALQVVENTGAAGDVILLHPLVLHVATPNMSKAPRFLLSGGVDLPSMWTASPFRGIDD